MAQRRTSGEPVGTRRMAGQSQGLSQNGKYVARSIAILVALFMFGAVALVVALANLYEDADNWLASAIIFGALAFVISIPFGLLLGSLVAQSLGYSPQKRVWSPRFSVAGLMFVTFLCCGAATMAYYAFNVASDALPRRYLFILITLALPTLLLTVVSVGRASIAWMRKRRPSPYNAEVIEDDDPLNDPD
ncbi:MAG: hypothetical protein ACIALR_10735 [Blastopirellula sp. JB062]